MNKSPIIIIFLVVLSGNAASQSIGVNPSEYNLGNVEPGQSYDLTFYLSISGTSDNLFIEPTVLGPQRSDIFDGETQVNPSEYSSENIKSWISWSSEEYNIDPTTSKEYQLSGGPLIAEGTMNATLKIPDSAEPGYHATQIGVNPRFPAGEGFGASILGLSRSRVIFRVEGEVRKQIEVDRIQARRIGENKAQFIFTLENTGTVTTEVKGGEYQVFSGGEKVGYGNIVGAEIPPEQSVRVDGRWIKQGMEGGNYRVTGKIQYGVSTQNFEERVSIADVPQDPIQVKNPSEQVNVENQNASVPFLLIIILTLGIAAFLYAVGLDILWILAFSGLTGITIFIITSNTPIYVLMFALMGAGTIIYLQW